MLSKQAKRWERYFRSFGIERNLIDAYVKYVSQLSEVERPIVFGFSHLASLLGRTRHYLASAIHGPYAHYRVFEIAKRNGGKREISAPYPALLECQQWIARNILTTADVHESAHGFISGRTIKSNAAVHLGARHLLKMDLADFFPSIHIRRVIATFRGFGYPPNISFFLARLCTLDERLPQGAATSPALSNVIAFRLDKRLHGIAKACNLNYARYADDLTFSGERIGRTFSNIIGKIVSEEGFQLRSEKTRLCRGQGQRIVTGICVDQDELRVPRQFRRLVRQQVHYMEKYGPISHISKLKIRRPYFLLEVYGKLRFWHWVEPKNAFAAESSKSVLAMIREMGRT